MSSNSATVTCCNSQDTYVNAKIGSIVVEEPIVRKWIWIIYLGSFKGWTTTTTPVLIHVINKHSKTKKMAEFLYKLFCLQLAIPYLEELDGSREDTYNTHAYIVA